MLKTILPPALIVAALGTMSGCSDLKEAIEFADTHGEFQAKRDALQARSNTAFTAIPDTGSSTYRGETSLAVGTKTNGVVLMGDAEIIIDFGDSTVNGTLSNFGGFDTDENISAYSGSLVFTDGVLGVNRPNDLESQIGGTLTGEDHTITVDAFWEGDLKGTPIGGVLGDTSAANSTFELDGNEVPGGIIVAVTN